MADESEAWSNAEQLRRFVATQEVACPTFRYNLHGLNSERCPECGSHLVLTLGLRRPRVGALLVCTVAFSMPAVLGILSLVVLASQGGGRPWGVDDWLWNWYLISTIASIPMLVATILVRNWFLRLSQWPQYLIANLAIVWLGMIAATFVYAWRVF